MQRFPRLSQPVHTTDPRPRLRLKSGLRSGLFNSQNQHYLHGDEDFDV